MKTQTNNFNESSAPISTLDYLKLFTDVHGFAGAAAFGYIAAALCKDIVMQTIDYQFPVMSIEGPKGSGKTELVRSLAAAFAPSAFYVNSTFSEYTTSAFVELNPNNILIFDEHIGPVPIVDCPIVCVAQVGVDNSENHNCLAVNTEVIDHCDEAKEKRFLMLKELDKSNLEYICQDILRSRLILENTFPLFYRGYSTYFKFFDKSQDSSVDKRTSLIFAMIASLEYALAPKSAQWSARIARIETSIDVLKDIETAFSDRSCFINDISLCSESIRFAMRELYNAKNIELTLKNNNYARKDTNQ